MRICLITHSMRPDTGTGVFAQRLAEGIRQGGHTVTALTAQAGGVPYERVALHPSGVGFLASWFAIRAAMCENDIVHVFDVYPYGIVAMLAGAGLEKPFIVTAIATGAVAKLDTPLSGRLMRAAYRRAHAIVAISEFTKREILKQIPDLAIRVIHLGVNYNRFHEARAWHNTTPPQPYVLGVGALRYRKGYDTSIAAFATVKDKFPDLSYIIVGKRYSDEYFKRLKNLAERLGVGERVMFRDNIDDESEFQKLYGQASIFLLTPQNKNNDFEGFGLVFLEAAAAGLPIVGTKESGVEEAVAEGENAILVPPGEAALAADALRKILGDPKLQKRMSDASLARARAFSWESKIDTYTELYKDVLRQQH